MEAKLTKTGISCYNNIFSQRIRKEETQETVVPDTMPDIFRILETNGSVLIRSKDVTAGRLKIEANVAARVVYVPEGAEGLSCLEMNVPVVISVESDELDEGAACNADLCLSSVSARVLNPRKVLVKAEVCAEIDCFAETVTDFVTDAKCSAEALNTRAKTGVFEYISCVTEKTFVVTDEFAIPGTKPAACDIYSATARMLAEDVKTVGTKLVFKGHINSRILYETEGSGLACAEFQTAFSQIVEAACCGENVMPQISLMLSGAYYELVSGSDGRTVNMELHLVAQVVCRDQKEVCYLSDAYSNKYPMNIESGAVEFEKTSSFVTLRHTLRELVEAPGQAAEVIAVRADCQTPTQEPGFIVLPLNVFVIYKADDGQLYSAGRRFDARLECDAPLRRIVSIDAGDAYASPAPGGAEVKVPIIVEAACGDRDTISFVSGIDIDEDARLDTSRLPSLVILRTDEQHDLWEIARDNCSTVEAIMAVNALETAESIDKKFLLVPKIV